MPTKRKFRVISIEGATRLEDLDQVESAVTTERGFMRMFYARWPNAARGAFLAVIDADGSADIFHKCGGRTARFAVT